MTAPRARSRSGSYPIPHPDTRELVELAGWTQLKNLLYAGGLETWKLKKVAAAVAKSTALQMMAADPEQCYAAVRKAMAAETDAADIGTMIHKHAEEIDRGTLNEDFVGIAAKPWLDHYRAARERFGWQLVEAEVTVCNHTLGYAGTADRFLSFPDLPGIGGGIFCVDMKTGKDVYPDTALQLRAYAGGEHIFEAYDFKTDPALVARRAQIEHDIANGQNIPAGRRKWSDAAIKQARAEMDETEMAVYAAESRFRPMPDGLRTDYGLVIHLTESGCRLIPLALDGAIDVVADLAEIWRWKARKDVLGDPVDPDAAVTPAAAHEPEPEPVDLRQQLEARLAQIKTVPPAAHELAQTWIASGRPTFKSGQPIDDSQLADIAEMMSNVEARYMARCAESRRRTRDATRLSLQRPGQNHHIPAECRYRWLRARLQAVVDAGHAQEVAAGWPDGTPQLTTFDHDDTALDRITVLLDEIEKEHDLPFGPSVAAFIPGDDHVEPGTQETVGLDEAVDRLEAAFDAWAEDADPNELKASITASIDKIASTRPHLLADIKARKERLGLTKRLRHDEWSCSELLQLAAIVNTAGEQ